MNAPVSITTLLDAETLARVEDIARARGRADAMVIAEAVREATAEATDLDTFVQKGVTSLERGEVHSQEEVEACSRNASRRDRQLVARSGPAQRSPTSPGSMISTPR
ncbi:CopG family ribbon-helix-helix protein [Sphingomonas sp. MMS24-JH45]